MKCPVSVSYTFLVEVGIRSANIIFCSHHKNLASFDLTSCGYWFLNRKLTLEAKSWMEDTHKQERLNKMSTCHD